MSEKLQFLSPEWEQAAEKFEDSVSPEVNNEIDIVINVTVTPTPFGDKELSIESKSGETRIEKFHLDNADLTVKTDYETAYRVFVGSEMNIILNAMLEGKLMVQGDIAKLLSSATVAEQRGQLPFSLEFTRKLQEITLDLDQDS